MRKIKGHQYRLKHYPFPRGKEKQEFIIAEAFLRNKMVSEEDLATLRSIQSDPPDLMVTIKKSEELRIEISESVPYNREYIYHSEKFIKDLQSRLCKLGTQPSEPSNIFIHTEGFVFPKITQKEMQYIAEKIDSFFKSTAFKLKYSVIQELVKFPLTVTFIPAQDTFALPARCYHNNLLIRNITGIPIDNKETEDAIKQIVAKKEARSGTADILIIFHGIIGMLSFDNIFDQMKENLLSGLTYEGIYILQLIELDNQYWTSVTMVREHPIFQGEAKTNRIATNGRNPPERKNL